MNRELLQQVRAIDPVSDTDRVVDVLVAEGVIEAIAPELDNLPPDTEIRDARGKILAPGLVDLYSTGGEPGFEERETFESLARSATAGGVTRLTLLPHLHPPLDNPSVLSGLQQLIPPDAPLSWQFWGSLTVGAAGEQMAELAELAAAGAIGFTDGKPLDNLMLVRRLLEYAQPLGKPIALWARDRALVGSGVMREGADSIQLGLPGDPAISETVALSAILECVAATGTAVHLMRVSTEAGVSAIRGAKERGLPVTASTSWMHLLLDTRAIGSYDPNLRLDPPLGNPSDRRALVEGVRSGIIDAIAIDHAPYTYEEKTVAFAEAPPGAIGLELALPLLWQQLVNSGEVSALTLWRSLSTRPAECLHQSPSSLQAGQTAEMTLFDPEQTWTVSETTLESRSRNTPWLHRQLTGRVLRVWGDRDRG